VQPLAQVLPMHTITPGRKSVSGEDRRGRAVRSLMVSSG
jgi:hypothetical protein